MATVLIVDDERPVTDAFAAFFERHGGHSVICAYSGAEAIAAYEATRPDLVLLDLRLPDMTGFDVYARIRDHAPVVIMISGHGDVPLAVEAMKAGAVDFLEKPFDDEALLAAVRAALRRQGSDDGREAERRELAQRIEALSGRERQVLEGLVAGQPNKIIAFDLGISPRTVEIYRANLMSKMQAASLSDLVRMALVVGLLPNRT